MFGWSICQPKGFWIEWPPALDAQLGRLASAPFSAQWWMINDGQVNLVFIWTTRSITFLRPDFSHESYFCYLRKIFCTWLYAVTVTHASRFGCCSCTALKALDTFKSQKPQLITRTSRSVLYHLSIRVHCLWTSAWLHACETSRIARPVFGGRAKG